ncbi:MAG: hypothetical protein AB8B51_07880 [Sedimentitalea sp.]
MKTTLLSVVAVLGLSVAAYAATEADANGDGMLTLDEVQAVFPEISTDTFTAMDVNADGALDGDEVAAAQDAGMMPRS